MVVHWVFVLSKGFLSGHVKIKKGSNVGISLILISYCLLRSVNRVKVEMECENCKKFHTMYDPFKSGRISAICDLQIYPACFIQVGLNAQKLEFFTYAVRFLVHRCLFEIVKWQQWCIICTTYKGPFIY